MTSAFRTVVPQTTPYTIMFSEDKQSKTYDSSFYNTTLTEGRATSEEVSQVLKEINAMRRPLIKKTSLILFSFVVSLVIVIGLFVIFSVFLMASHPLISDYGLIFSVILLLISLGFFTLSFRRNQQDCRKAAAVIVSKYNIIFASKGLRWQLPAEFPRWIELWKDYLGQPNTQASFYIPPLDASTNESHFQQGYQGL